MNEPIAVATPKPLPQLTAEECLKGQEDLNSPRKGLEGFPDAVGLIKYVNHDLSHRLCGDTRLVVFGPSNTIRDQTQALELRCYPFETRPHGMPWQYLPEGWCPREELLAFLGPAKSV